MGAPLYAVGVLTVSDTCSRDASSDASGPLLRRTLESHPSDAFRVGCSSIVPDEPKAIRSTVTQWIDELGIKLVITTGGTGLGVRDTTPEALSPLIDKPTPGITQAIIADSLARTPLAALSRLVTGIRQVPFSSSSSSSKHGSPGALIIALPGSPKAIKECLQVLLGTSEKAGILLHALELCTGLGGVKAGHKTHQELQHGHPHHHGGLSGTETDTGASRHQHIHQHPQPHHNSHNHHHHHHHHGSDHSHGVHSHSAPQARTAYLTHSAHGSSTLRARQSPYPILPLDQALLLINEHTPMAREVVQVPVDERLVGHVLAEDVSATTDLPPGNTTNVDGYAVNAASTPPGKYKVVTASILTTRVAEGQEQDASTSLLKPGEVCRVNTGQGLPAGTDGVVMVEDTALISTTAQDEEDEIEILAQIDPMENVRRLGSDVRAGMMVLPAGTTISALGGEIGTLAFLGKTNVSVYRKPKVALLSTGDELRDLKEDADQKGGKEAWGFKVYDANRPGLRAAIEGMGLEVVDLGILGDNPTKLTDSLRRGAQEADIILTTGGTSMGESDFLKPIIERELQGSIHFGRVAMKPGKPTTFATLPAPSGQTGSTLLFALPGNPASALVCFYIFALPCLRKLLGVTPSSHDLAAGNGEGQAKLSTSNPYSLPRIKVRLTSEMRLDPRPEFHRVVLGPPGRESEDGLMVARSTGAQRSSGMHSMATANALVCVPALEKGAEKKSLKAGEVAEAILLGTLS
ncbi:hypothetical protein BCV69DRAFT_285652 [Microstroma glucosiphilum]|uniref:MoaB/Mog domain-containing protein n=1 Tax=Pseudomicrostroma glucosiphilum TaxID=1684307 RepID=A0A316TWS4_9BASI|nr:hypothetical protein BCV69DRAFT_285652 [Pseudomicrostroma glucosiphilum]PWN17767.1 hypothetical protein BCV69DRAFT_285652 [Pseudomicrostroma glucosiphilum]